MLQRIQINNFTLRAQLGPHIQMGHRPRSMNVGTHRTIGTQSVQDMGGGLHIWGIYRLQFMTNLPGLP